MNNIKTRLPMLNALTTLGDSTSIEGGQVVIETHNGFKITSLPKDIACALAKEILELFDIKAFFYTGIRI